MVGGGDPIHEKYHVSVGSVSNAGGVATAFVANELVSDGTIEVQESNQSITGQQQQDEGPVDVVFEESQSETREADYNNMVFDQGENITDDFVVENNHRSEVNLTFESCQNYQKTYSAGSTAAQAEQLNGNQASIPSGDDLYVVKEIQIPQDAQTRSQDLCTEVTAEPV